MTDSHLPIGCSSLDELLGGGLERGTVTQLYGPPAAGKTNVALQAAVRTAADGGTVVYVDTEGLSVDRFGQVLDAHAEDPDAASSRIIVKNAHDFQEQAEAVRDVQDFAEQADLVVLDSATGFYRLQRGEDVEGGEALRDVAGQITHLLSLARKHDLAVLITNQVYTDVETEKTRALGGHTLTHWTGTVVRLDRFRGGNRRASLEKHRAKAEGETTRFKITDQGVTSAAQP